MAEQQPAYMQYMMPQSATSIIPQQMGQDYLSNLEQTLNHSEQQQMNQLLASQNQMGALSSGGTNYGLANIAGNTQNQFASAYTGMAGQAAGQANQQQFGQQMEEQDFQNWLKQMQQQSSYDQALLAMKAQMGMGPFAAPKMPSFGQVLGQNFAQSLPAMTFGAGAGAGQAALSRYMAGPQPMSGNMFGGPMMQGGGLNLTPFGGQNPSGQYAGAFGSGDMGFGSSSMFSGGY